MDNVDCVGFDLDAGSTVFDERAAKFTLASDYCIVFKRPSRPLLVARAVRAAGTIVCRENITPVANQRHAPIERRKFFLRVARLGERYELRFDGQSKVPDHARHALGGFFLYLCVHGPPPKVQRSAALRRPRRTGEAQGFISFFASE